MANLEKYIEKYGNTSFYKKEFNDIDAVILSNILYLDLEGIVNENKNAISLQEAISKFLYYCDYKEFLTRGFVQNDVYKLATMLLNKKRYAEIKLQQYKRIVNDTEQFCAMCYRLPNHKLVVGFEGTDHNLSGWEEDLAMAYEYPIPSQKDAIIYLNSVVGLFDNNITVLGHSKGGNLALVSSMYAKKYIQMKIKTIYSFDGPGLRKKEFTSKNFKRVEPKLKHIIPNYSVFGLLLRHNDSFQVVHSTKKDIYAHSIFTWQIEEDHFEEGKLSTISKNLDKSIIIWLEQHDDETRKKIAKAIFSTLRKSGIKNFMETTKIKNVITILKNSKEIDKETMNLLLHFVKFNVSYCFTNRKGNKEEK